MTLASLLNKKPLDMWSSAVSNSGETEPILGTGLLPFRDFGCVILVILVLDLLRALVSPSSWYLLGAPALFLFWLLVTGFFASLGVELGVAMLRID